ncbi:hypothetical protein ACXET9_05190 [Brachybacterium sp. DNPG3]
MDLDRASGSRSVDIVGRRPDRPIIPSSEGPQQPLAPLLPEVTTPLLRRCTALAAKARVELLSQRLHAAADELGEVLDQISRWTPSLLVSPDPTMLALCTASLQDLVERMPESDPSVLTERIDRVLDLLHGVLDRESAHASA